MTRTTAFPPRGENAPVAIALINDYEVIIRGVERMLAPFAERIEIVELDASLPASQPVDISLYDTFALPHVDRATIDDILAHPHSGAVVIYSWNTDPDLVAIARTKGVAGYLPKSLPAADLVEALERIHRGEMILTSRASGTPEQSEDVTAAADGDHWPGQAFGLSARESEVLALVSQGLSNEEIAARSFLSINTIKTYIRNAYRKIGVNTRPKAVIWGMTHGLAPDKGRIVRNTRPAG